MVLSVHKTVLTLLLLCLTLFTGIGQPRLSQGILGPVLDNPSRLSGNFGEFRSNHLHSGIDYKTEGTTGLPVYAASDGYVSRIKVSGGGYGKALYLTHPQFSMVTVYAHLRAFSKEVEDTVSQLMFNRELYETELFPPANQFPVKKGQIIGYSGSTGASEGPHLHFETRELKSEKPFNPERAGFKIADSIPPEITALVIYRPGFDGSLSGSERQQISIPQGQYHILLNDTVHTSAQFFIGFEGYDRAGNEPNTLGIKKWEFKCGCRTHHSAKINAFHFNQTRMVNAMIDYGYKSETGRTINLCYTLPGNRLPFFGRRNGLVNLQQDEVRKCFLKIEDQVGNFKQIDFVVRRGKESFGPVQPPGRKVNFEEKATLSGDGFELLLPPYSLVENTYVEAMVDSVSENGFPILKISPEETPLIIPAELSFNLLEPSEKLVPIRIGNNGSVTPVAGKFTGMIRLRQFGVYTLMIDSLPPDVSMPIWVNDPWSGHMMMEIPATDALSGIRDYRVEVNGKWVPAAWTEFHGVLTVFPEHLPLSGDEIRVKVSLSDFVSNRSEHLFTLKR